MVLCENSRRAGVLVAKSGVAAGSAARRPEQQNPAAFEASARLATCPAAARQKPTRRRRFDDRHREVVFAGRASCRNQSATPGGNLKARMDRIEAGFPAVARRLDRLERVLAGIGSVTMTMTNEMRVLYAAGRRCPVPRVGPDGRDSRHRMAARQQD